MDRIQKLADAPPGVAADAEGSSVDDPLAGSHVPVHGMGPHDQGAPDLQTNPHQPSEDASALHRASGHVSGSIHHPEIPCLANETRERSLPVAAPSEPSGGSPMGIASSSMPIQRVDTDGYQPETTQPLSIPPGLEAGGILGTQVDEGHWQGLQRPQGLQGPVQAADHQEGIALSLNRNDMMSTLTQLRLQNHSNWCFANSVFQTFIWCFLSLSHFQVDMRGIHRDSILRFLARAKDQVVSLAEESFVADVLRCWGPSDLASFHGSINQHDAAEYVQHWLQLLQSKEFDMRWEKRILAADGTLIHDSSQATHMPISFQFDATTQLMQFCDLTALGMIWRQVDGMHTCLGRGLTLSLHSP